MLVAVSHDGTLLLRNPYDNPICKLSYNHEIILCMLVKHSASKILGDDSDLPIIHAEDQRWIVQQWLPRARTAGLKAAASVLSLTFFGRVAIGSIQSRFVRHVQVRNFRKVHSARSWLKDVALDRSSD